MVIRRSPLPLASWYVISLRPEGGHAALRRAASRCGARVFALSTLRLVGIQAGAMLAKALAAPRVIVTSPAAVRFACQQTTLAQRPGQQWFAVGTGSAKALQRAGITQVHVPTTRQDAEGLLALPELQNVHDQAIGLITAPGGRQLIPDTLKARGATLRPAEVYCREPIHPKASRLHALTLLPQPCAVMVSSAEAFDGLWSAIDTHGQQRLTKAIAVASSPRLAMHLREHGFTQVVIARDATPDHLLQALCEHVGSTTVPVG